MNILECGYFARCEVKLNGYVGMGHLWFKWVGHAYLAQMGQLWQSELLFFGGSSTI